jgi:hypothetical protein
MTGFFSQSRDCDIFFSIVPASFTLNPPRLPVHFFHSFSDEPLLPSWSHMAIAIGAIVGVGVALSLTGKDSMPRLYCLVLKGPEGNSLICFEERWLLWLSYRTHRSLRQGLKREKEDRDRISVKKRRGSSCTTKGLGHGLCVAPAPVQKEHV